MAIFLPGRAPLFEKSQQAIGLPFRVGGLDIKKWLDWTAEHPAEAAAIWEEVKNVVGWPSEMFYVAPINEARGTGWGNNYYIEADGLDPLVLSEIEVRARLQIWDAVQWLKQRLPAGSRPG